MKSGVEKTLTGIAALASLVSGLFWALSAKAQVDILQATGLSTSEVAEKLNYLSQHENLWAASAAAVAGVAVGLTLFFK